MKHYELRYYTGIENEWEIINCLISNDMIDQLLFKRPSKFISVVVDDGEIMIIHTDNINKIKECYKS
jgi:DNA-binding sugar fermentation-stimulating protein